MTRRRRRDGGVPFAEAFEGWDTKILTTQRMGGPFGPGVMCLLDDLGGKATWTQLRDELGVSSSSLNNHLNKLESNNYVRTDKYFSRRKPRTDVSLTDRGREAIDDFYKRISRYLEGKQPPAPANNPTHETPDPRPPGLGSP